MTLYHWVTIAQKAKALNMQKERLKLSKQFLEIYANKYNTQYNGNCTIPNYNKHTTINNYYDLKTDQDK